MTASESTTLARTSRLWVVAIGLGALPCNVLAQDDFFDTIETDVATAVGRKDNAVSMIAWLTEKIGYGLESPSPLFSRHDAELNRVETSLFAQVDGRVNESTSFRISGKAYYDAIYQLNDDTDYSKDERDKFETRFELKDFYIETPFENGFYLKVGNQLVVWGQSEYLRVTDLINSEDQYTFGQQDLEDIRLQLPAVLATIPWKSWSFDGVITYDAGRDNISPARDEFDQFVFQNQDGSSSSYQVPVLEREDSENESEIFFRASTHFENGDFELIAGEFNDNALSVTEVDGSQLFPTHVVYSQNRMRAVGLSANWARGSWLFFGELGMHFDKAVRPVRDTLNNVVEPWDQKDQRLSVVGIEYNGFRNAIITLEANNTYTHEYDEFMLADENQSGFGARLYWTALNDRLEVLAVWNKLADNASNLGRLSVNYNWTDSFQLGLLWVDYHSENESPFYPYRNNDVMELQFRYSFQY